MEQANVKWNKQMWNETSKCEMEQANVKSNKQMWNGTSKGEMEQAKVKSNKQMWNRTAINLVPRVLSLLRERTLVAADHVSARFQKNKGRQRQDSESFVLHVNWYWAQ